MSKSLGNSLTIRDALKMYNYEVIKYVMLSKHYGSDVEATLSAGADIRHGLIGAGVYASHGYERSHKDGVENTLRLLLGYTI
jgi:putative aminopeptidase FrvX